MAPVQHRVNRCHGNHWALASLDLCWIVTRSCCKFQSTTVPQNVMDAHYCNSHSTDIPLLKKPSWENAQNGTLVYSADMFLPTFPLCCLCVPISRQPEAIAFSSLCCKALKIQVDQQFAISEGRASCIALGFCIQKYFIEIHYLFHSLWTNIIISTGDPNELMPIIIMNCYMLTLIISI